MTILFMGGEAPSFLPSGSGFTEATDSGYFNTPFSRCALWTRNTFSWWDSQIWPSQTGLYVHGVFRQSVHSSGSDDPILTLYDGATASIFLKQYTDDRLALQYLNAGAVVTGADIDNFSGGLEEIDLYVNLTTGVLRLYAGGTKRLETTGLSLGHITGITGLRLNNNYYMAWSQVVVDTNPTIGGRLWTVPITGAGASSDWNGTYANIDEIAYSDADFINSATNGQVSTFAVNPPTLTGYEVQAVGVYARVRCGAGGPQNFRPVLRSGGTNYPSAADQLLDIAYEPHGYIWETDPATGVAWINTAVATLQPGVKAIT